MTVIYPSPISGLIRSRRLGLSLGINLMPPDGKCCSFDCLYCECGFNHDFIPHHRRPMREEVASALEEKLKELREQDITPDVLTFSGNGEPTLHPQFADIIDDTITLRNRHLPSAKVSVLTTATQILRQPIFDALCRVDNNMCKLDTVSPEYIKLVDRPNINYDVAAIVERLHEFGKRCVIQTMFMQGEYEGVPTSNISDDFVLPWLDNIKYISPREVMIYTIDRETPAKGLLKASHEHLDSIQARVKQLGIPCKVAY